MGYLPLISILVLIVLLVVGVGGPILAVLGFRRLVRWATSAPAAAPERPAEVATGLLRLGCGGLSLLVLVGPVAYVASLQWGFHVQRQRNAALRADVAVVVAGLASYARAHEGRYPPRGELAAALRPYLPGGRLPPSPWSRAGADLPVSDLDAAWAGMNLEHKPWPGAAALAAGQRLPKEGQFLYAGPRGALIYDVTPDRRVYVVYGLGERSSPDSPAPLKMPKLVAAATNADRPAAAP